MALVKNMNAAITSPSPTILQRIADTDKSAINECLNVYGNFIWRTIRKQNLSSENTEKIVQDVFADIWRFAERYDSMKFSENDFILMLIRHRLRETNLI